MIRYFVARIDRLSLMISTVSVILPLARFGSLSVIIDASPAGTAPGGPQCASARREVHAAPQVPCRLDGVLVLAGGRAVPDVRHDLRAVRPDPCDRGAVADHHVDRVLDRLVVLGPG